MNNDLLYLMPFLVLLALIPLIDLPPDFGLSKEIIERKRTSIMSLQTAREDYTYLNYDDAEQLSMLLSNSTFFGVKARAFPKWHGESIPCFPPSNKKPRERGLLYLKLEKTGGSTATGINARIAHNEAKRNNATFKHCDAQFGHTDASEMCPHRDKDQSFLWSTVRDPISRLTSYFFYSEVSLTKVEPTDENMIQYFNRKAKGHYLESLSTYSTLQDGDMIVDPVQVLNDIMNEYNYISVTERMEESAVVLAMLLNIPLGDVLYLDSKRNGAYSGKCEFIVPSFLSSSTLRLFQTDDFQARVFHWDRVLHQVVNRSLDMTIDETLGRVKFEAKLAKFRHAQNIARQRCHHLEVANACSMQGRVNKPGLGCLYLDAGCGYDCLNKVADELNLW